MTEQELESSGIVVGKTETYDSNGHHEVKYFKHRTKSPLQQEKLAWYNPPVKTHMSFLDFVDALFQGISQGLDKAAAVQNKRLGIKPSTDNDEVIETDDGTSEEAEEIEEQLTRARKQMDEMEEEMQSQMKNALATGLLLGRYVH